MKVDFIFGNGAYMHKATGVYEVRRDGNKRFFNLGKNPRFNLEKDI